MPIVRQPLANRLFNAAKTGLGIYQGQKMASAGRNLLEAQGMEQFAPFINPMTGEMGGVGKNLFDLYGAVEKSKANTAAALNQQMIMANYRDKLEESRFKRKSVQDIMKDMEDQVTIGPKGTSVKPGLLQMQFGVDPSTVSASDKKRIAERLYEGQGIDRSQVIPGQAYEEPGKIPLLNIPIGGKEYKQTQFGF